MRLSEYASTRKTRGSYKMPRSVQQSIPIDRIYADGVWQSENVFSLMWQISDINYAMQSDAAKQNILMQLGTVYAGIPADCWMQVCIVSQRMDEKAFARDVLYHRENDGFDALRAERNRQIKANARENGNVVQHKYIIVSTNKPGVKEARERFVQVQGHLLSAFSALECAVTPLDNRARLEVLHKFFRISEEGRFNFDFDNCAKLGQDFRDSIAPDCIRFCKKHIEIEDFYAKCMTISEYPQQLDDKFISALLQQVPYIVLSIDIEPVETEDAFKEIDNAQMKTDAEKVRFNKKSVENLDFTSSVPQRTQEQDRIIASIRKEMTENDQQMFLSLLTVTYFADTLEDLALETDALKTTAANYNCRFTELYFQQERAFDTAMPYGLRRIESVRTMLTKSLTALVPFNTQEILTPGGICYGRNAVTGNLIIGLRTTLVNGNAMVVATSGGGKSMFVKLEILMLYLRFTKQSASSLCAKHLCGPRRRANAPPSSGRNYPKNTHKPRCSRAFPMWLPVQATPPKAPPASATASFVQCRRSGKISPCRAAPNLHQNRLKKRKSLFPRRPSAGKCSKRSASGKRPSQPKHQRRKPRCRHRPHRHRRLTKPKCSST